MAQHDYVIANGTGAAVRSDLNNALAAIVSQNSGATTPSTTYAYQWWADTTTGLLKLRNAANSAWITLFQLDGEWSTIALENGTAAAPSIYFKDSGTDTGFYSPGTDQVGISTGGTARLTIDASGNVNIDSNTLYVDASNNRVGLGSSTPQAKLDCTNAGKGGIVSLDSTSYAAGVGGTIDLGGNYRTAGDFQPFVRIAAEKANSTNADYGYGMGFYVTTNGGSSFGTKALTIDSSARVGIGDNAPSVRLSVLNGTDNSDVAVFSGGDRTRGLKITTGAAGGNNDALVQLNAQNSAGQFAVLVNGSEAYRVDNSKRLLVGTSSPDTSYYDAGSFTPHFQFKGANASASGMSLTRTDGSGPVMWFQAGSSGNSPGIDYSVGGFAFSGYDGANYRNAAHIEAYVDGTPGSGDMPGRLVFSTTADGASSPTEAMRINNKGQVGINYAGIGSGRGLFMQASTNSSADYSIYLINSTAAKADFGIRNDGYLRSEAMYTQTTASAANVFVDSNGFVQRSTSSLRYKREIVDANYSLQDIDKLRPVNYKSSIAGPDGEVSDQVFGGLIAEELNEAGFEEFVVLDEQGRPDAIQYGQMIAVAIKGLQEATARIKELEVKVAALEAS